MIHDKISYLPDLVTEEKIKSGELVFLNVVDVETDIWKQLIYHKNKWLSNSLSALIEYIKIAEFNNQVISMQKSFKYEIIGGNKNAAINVVKKEVNEITYLDLNFSI